MRTVELALAGACSTAAYYLEVEPDNPEVQKLARGLLNDLAKALKAGELTCLSGQSST